MKRLAALALVSLVAISQLVAEEPAAPAPSAPDISAQKPVPAMNIFVEMQVVDIPTLTAAPLVHELMDPGKIENAYDKIQGLIASGVAKLVSWPMLTTHDRERAVFEAIREFRYATEYDTGGVGFYFSDQDSAQKLAPAPGTNQKPLIVDGTEFNATPSSFETRNVGVTLEVNPSLSADGRMIELDIVPQHVRLKAMNKISIERPSTKEQIVVEQPEFESNKSMQTFTLKSGERRLLGVYPVSDPANHLELFILKAEARKVE